jgi:hypothetical protein
MDAETGVPELNAVKVMGCEPHVPLVAVAPISIPVTHAPF